MAPNLPSQRTVTGALHRLAHPHNRPLSSLRSYPEEADSFDGIRLAEFAVGDLPMLAIGTFFRDGRALFPRRALLPVTTFHLDFDQQRVFRLEDEPAILPRESLMLSGLWGPMRRSACVAFPWHGDPYGVCVPVTELLRWCYGSSSRMLQAVLSGELEQVLDEVTAHSQRREQTLDLTLPPGFPEQDAHTLAWLSQDAHARRQALTVDRSVMISRQKVGGSFFSYPSALFPYGGRRRVKAQGRWLRGPHGRDRFLVHQLREVDFSLPFQVTLPVAHHGEQDDRPETQGRRLPPARPQHTTLVSDQEPRRAGEARLLTALPSQFSGEQVLPREDNTEVLPQPLTFAASSAPTGPLSTGLGSDTSSQARQVTITRKRGEPLPEPAPPRDDFATLRRVADLLRQGGLDVQEQPVTVPPEHGLFLMMHLHARGQHAYLLEKARHPGEYGPLLIAAREGLGAAPAADLLPLMTTRERRRAWLASREGWTLLTVPHAYADDARFAAGIRKRVEGLDGWRAES